MSVEEKQAELDALQAAFDEYITSSRELEEELEEELNKCRESTYASVLMYRACPPNQTEFEHLTVARG